MTTQPAVEAYRRIARVYDAALNPVTSLERRVLAGMLPEMRGLRVIDVGAGTGYWAAHCSALGAHAVAIDACWEMLQSARGHRVVGDALCLPVRDGAADVVICSLMLGYARAAFTELARVVKPGGALFVTDLHPDALARGWERSFRVGDEIVRPSFEIYAIDELRCDSLQRTRLVEAPFAEPERALFQQAGYKREPCERSTAPERPRGRSTRRFAASSQTESKRLSCSVRRHVTIWQ